jgi:hypothetical protein
LDDLRGLRRTREERGERREVGTRSWRQGVCFNIETADAISNYLNTE